MANETLTDAIRRIRATYPDDSVNWREIAEQVNQSHGTDLSGEAARGRFKRSRGKAPREPDLIFPNVKNPKDLSFPEMIGAFEQTRDFRAKTSIGELTALAAISATKPIALCVVSDAHIGSPYTNYKALLDDMTTIRETQGLYVLLGGDMCDLFMPQFKDKMAPINALQPPQIQLLTEEKLLEYLSGKIVARNGGNHDRMPQRETGIDVRYFIERDKPYPILPNGGLVRLTVGEVEYKILWKHDYRFKSSLNQFNVHHRMLEQLEPDADIVVTEHEHNPGIESVERGEFDSRRTVVSIRAGAYKGSDPFSVRYFKSGRRGPQTVILWPDRRKILAMHGADALTDATIYLNGYNSRTGDNGETKKET